MPFKNRIRLPLYLKTPQFPSEANRFRLADGSTKTLSVVIRKTYNLVTDWMPAYMHQRLVIALNHDVVNIEGDRYVGGVAVDGEYKIDWIDFLDYPVAPAEVQIQVTPFAATNDNCQTCEEATQLSVSDDTIEGDINEGDDGTINAFSNDNICCSPVTTEIVSFNTTYVSAATIDDEGNVIVTIKNPAPPGTNVLLVTYRVSCPNGAFDEANVYGNVLGTDIVCEVPTDLLYTNVSPGNDSISWTGTGDFEWQLYTCDNLGTPIQTGTSTGSPELFTDLSPGQCYQFSIRKDCGGGSFSEYETLEFNVPAAESDCGRFEITADDGTMNPTFYNYSFMDCNGNIINLTIQNLQTRTNCFLMDLAHNPIYFEGSVVWITYEYITDCGF